MIRAREPAAHARRGNAFSELFRREEVGRGYRPIASAVFGSPAEILLTRFQSAEVPDPKEPAHRN
jgi:hypothetical protein